jgi:hypothetical protein
LEDLRHCQICNPQSWKTMMCACVDHAAAV